MYQCSQLYGLGFAVSRNFCKIPPNKDDAGQSYPASLSGHRPAENESVLAGL